ncbi:glycoside hydrolase family 15 protein [Streptomyces sp. AV19]|uniref:glycoside hydrolase family 15 protein n=1 Tax=Streptomyces sp. AV19 TaxID=2793068 RepID=UPI0018FEF400|nr:glycoside hydrolase family 15 protein [Streptomyces sp. AV19]MBH1934343.1 glycoside hydrolase family 15 protein [Streptomyces sp. AV19]MDG4533349.1 glycoside hydrolase family 15 protein [Streptomyces sp. AV19]
MNQWRRVVHEPYPPIEDHGLVGDGRGSALVGRTGAVGFMCVPRFDSPPLFCPLLDHARGGRFDLLPDGLRESRQYYVEDTAVLVTELRTDTATVELTDAFLLRPGARLEEDVAAGLGCFVRRARVLHGRTRLAVTVRPRGGAQWVDDPAGWRVVCPHQQLELLLCATRPLAGPETNLPLEEGQEMALTLTWHPGPGRRPAGGEGRGTDRHLDDTAKVWRRWSGRLMDDVPRADLVRRSALTLKLLDHVENGAIVAAPTSSLPERIGGNRNWDYRYAWVRDTAYTVFALRRIGLPAEAGGFLAWALRATEEQGPMVLYDLDGRPPPPETADGELEGYRGSAPVRWGNAAARQVQHDIYGEILDCAFQWAATGGRLDGVLWPQLAGLAERARTAWKTPDHGIWEVRTAGRPFTYSAAMCQVALDRAARLSRRLGLPGSPDTWSAEAQAITERILRYAWDERSQALTEHLGPGGGLDASLLALPLRRVLPADHPRMVATTRAVADRLGAGGGLLYRYLPDESPDGLDEAEGAFVLCSFWLVDNLVGQGRIGEAEELFEEMCSYASPLGLLAEQIDPGSRTFLGNFPQGLSHVGLIASAVGLARVHRGVRPELATHAWFD